MAVPSALALTSIADGASIVASDHRNNYTSIQSAVNAIVGFLTGASSNQLLRYNGTDWTHTSGLTADASGNLTANQVVSSTLLYAGTVTGGTGVTSGVYVANGGGVPTTPGGGGVLFVASGALKYIGSSGTVTTLAAA